MKSKDTRRRKALRYSLHTCTIIALLLLGSTIWPKPYAYHSSANNAAGVSRGISLVLLDGVLMNSYWTERPPQARNAPSTISGFGRHGALAPAWYTRPIFQRGYIQLPLVYPASLLLMLSLTIAIMRRRAHPEGHCHNCNYDLSGIDQSICPECGNEPTA